MRLIDADALMRDIGESIIFSVRPDRPSAELRGARKVVDRIEAAPTVDAVEVVRCRECVYRTNWICNHPYGLLHIGELTFCSYGERR